MTGRTPESELSVSALEYDRDGPHAVVSLAGRATISDCAWVRALLELRAAHGQGRLVIDLSQLSSMDWWVALMLTWVGRVVSRRGGVLVLASPQPAVARLLDAAGAPKSVATDEPVQHAVGGTAMTGPTMTGTANRARSQARTPAVTAARRPLSATRPCRPRPRRPGRRPR
jgi:anti-anti-sigma factor